MRSWLAALVENISRLAGHSSLWLLIMATYSHKQAANDEVNCSVVSIETTVHSNVLNIKSNQEMVTFDKATPNQA